MEVVLMSNDELIEEDKRAIKQRPTTLKYQCGLNENKDGMRYINLRLERSGLERKGWVIGVIPLKGAVLVRHPIYKATPTQGAVLVPHPIYKSTPLEVVSPGTRFGCINTFQGWWVM
jgi:hypothetical protein